VSPHSLTEEAHVRKLVALFAVLALTAGLAACGDDDDGTATTDTGAASGDSDFTPREDGVLTVGTELPAPPFWEGEDYDAITGGYEVDLAKEIAQRLGDLEFKPVNYPFSGVNAGVECECDLVFSQITITDERAAKWDFSTPYFDSDQGLMTLTGTDVADVAAAKGLQFGVQTETTGLDFLNDTLQPASDARVYDTTVDMFNALAAGDIDAILFDVPILLGAIKGGQISDAKIVAQFKTGEQYGAILPKDSANTAAVNAAMQAIIDDGTLASLQEKYFGVPTEDAAPFWEA
jgi:polar amino acid transport system substrate-binding protein